MNLTIKYITVSVALVTTLCMIVWDRKYTISSVALPTFTEETVSQQHRNLQADESHIPKHVLFGKRVTFAISSFGTDQFLYLQDQIDSIRDLCEFGVGISVIIYTTFPYTAQTINLLNARTQCRHPSGNVNIRVVVQSANLKEHFVDAHRQYFYRNLDKFDLFVYTEDDLNIRPTHIVSYLDETEKLKALVGPKAFPGYGLGFLRYERDEASKQHVVWEQKDRTIHRIKEPALREKYFTVRMPHQAMYMATREQLVLWKDRCQFDQIDPENEEPEWLERYGPSSLHREFVSSLRLFTNELSEKGCRVQQVFPLKTMEDFMVHHISDLYHTKPFWTRFIINSIRIQDMREQVMSEEDKKFIGSDGKYNGIKMVKDTDSLNWDGADESMKKYIVEIDRMMGEYQEYTAKGGGL